MIRKIDSKTMGKSNLGWLNSTFHFSFAEYFNPTNINFGVLRVINDDLIIPHEGFDTHPHQDMEIVSYVIAGELTHADSMGNKRTLKRGQVQYMSAGTGVFHSEHNLSDETLRLLQIWIFPDKKGYQPNYGDYLFDWDLRKNNWLNIVSGKNGDAPIKINQDVNIYVLELEKDMEEKFEVEKGRQAYLVQIEGEANINEEHLNARDAMEIKEETISIKAIETSHYLVIEMRKDGI
ncbi:pirin family protein [Lachnoclostridium phytofermentans]|uniref:Pirin domain protein n=1 Tax=Lachnoclostridium phytofermentans (strain ATCC 700394 / DSM 18823 / ISDg) TaxID=357809 RepID=A9KT03_LACP7|nr:pirin family protein [Lachnoclostridium phytofermentans]ABX42214.1 Pirin domain protein [Lachnoclostridium phytofermentans ISDg]